MERLKILEDEVLEKQNSFIRVRRWVKGWHPELKNSVLVKGIHGKETLQEMTGIEPIGVFYVEK